MRHFSITKNCTVILLLLLTTLGYTSVYETFAGNVMQHLYTFLFLADLSRAFGTMCLSVFVCRLYSVTHVLWLNGRSYRKTYYTVN